MDANQLIERKPIEGTPFTLIKQTTDNDKQLYFIVMGDHRITEPTFTEQTQLNILISDYWKILTTVIAIIVEKTLLLHQTPYETDSL